jgi:type IX secretion system PorP/SprF family membrane protein
MKKLIVLLCSLLITLSYAQQDSQFSQYMYNTININPAYAGTRGSFNAFVLHRNQWVGLNGAPITNAASINTNFEESRLGLGLSFINDQIGATQEKEVLL